MVHPSNAAGKKLSDGPGRCRAGSNRDHRINSAVSYQLDDGTSAPSLLSAGAGLSRRFPVRPRRDRGVLLSAGRPPSVPHRHGNARPGIQTPISGATGRYVVVAPTEHRGICDAPRVRRVPVVVLGHGGAAACPFTPARPVDSPEGANTRLHVAFRAVWTTGFEPALLGLQPSTAAVALRPEWIDTDSNRGVPCLQHGALPLSYRSCEWAEQDLNLCHGHPRPEALTKLAHPPWVQARDSNPDLDHHKVEG